MRTADKVAAWSSLMAMGSLAVISGRQLGWTGPLPELPGQTFQTNHLVTSNESRILGLPDGPLGLLSYALTLGLALRGSPLTRYKVGFDLLYAVTRSGRTYAKTGALCGWCLIALGCSLVSRLALFLEDR